MDKPSTDRQDFIGRIQLNPKQVSVAVATIILLLTVLLAVFYYRIQVQNERANARKLLSDINARMDDVFAYSELAAMTMAQGILSDDLVPDFEQRAQQVLSSNDYIDGVQMVPNGVISQVYPYEEHKAVIGYDIMADSKVNKEARQAISTRRMFFAGPFRLKQGGLGVVGRLPVYRDGGIWGFSAVVIRLDRLLNKIGLENSGKSGYYFQLGKVNPNTGEEEFFMESSVIPNEESKFDFASFPDSGWKIYVIQSDGFRNKLGLILILFFGLLISFLSGYAIWAILQRGKELSHAHQRLAWQHQEMRDSIHGAKYLQKSVLQTEQDVRELFKESFVLFEPKDAVSGDFLWVHGDDQHRIVAVVDCTGHGVSAALMSMIAGQLLHQIVVLGKITRPAEILDELDKAVLSILQTNDAPSSMHGMDMVICRFDAGSNSVSYAGANRPLYVQFDNELQELPTTRHPIGGYTGDSEKVFSGHLVDVSKAEQLFLTTDGYHSQFGGPDNKKLGRRKLRDFLLELKDLPCNEQAARLKSRLNEWKGDQEQVDDVLIVGIKV